MVSNNGRQPATGVSVVDTLPAELTFVSASPGCSELAGTVTCVVGDLGAGEGAQLTIVVTPNIAGLITNTEEVSGDETDPENTNNSASADTTVEMIIISFYVPITKRAA